MPDRGTPPGYAELERIAATTARAAAELVTATYGRPDPVGHKSSPTDVVTQTDLRTEELIRRHLREVTPEAGVLGEEGETTKPGARVQWVIDPLDGTVNFLYGVPLFAVSIAAALDGEGLVPGGPLPGGPVGACYYTASGTLESGTLTLVGRSLLTNRVPTLADSEDPGKSDTRADGREFNSTVNVKTGEVINWSLSTPGGTFKSDPASPALVMVARGGRTRRNGDTADLHHGGPLSRGTCAVACAGDRGTSRKLGVRPIKAPVAGLPVQGFETVRIGLQPWLTAALAA